MSAKALKYAEETLGVHKIFDETNEWIESLDEMLAELDKAQDRKRELDEMYADREVDLINEMRGVHPSMSDTRFKSEFRGWERTDKTLREIRVQLIEIRSTIQGIEYDVDITKLRIKAGSSRMEELGGYLHYLAVVKQNQAEIANKNTQREETA